MNFVKNVKKGEIKTVVKHPMMNGKGVCKIKAWSHQLRSYAPYQER